MKIPHSQGQKPVPQQLQEWTKATQKVKEETGQKSGNAETNKKKRI